MDKYEGYETVEEEGPWKPTTENNTLKGVVVYVNPNGPHGEEYTIETENKEKVVLPHHTVLMKKMVKTTAGDRVIIEYVGEKDVGKGKPLQLYEVYRKRV